MPAAHSPTPVDHERALAGVLDRLGALVVAFSGGVDSACLAEAAHRTLGPGAATVVTAVSPSLAGAELADARRLARERGWVHLEVATAELADDAYRANDGDRCARCKDALLDALVPLAAERDATVVLGVNLDDLGDHRPGQQAAARRGACFPFVEAGLDKAAVRSLARHFGLDVWDKPAAACLASRVPYGTPVSAEVLARIEAAEAGLVALGFGEVRVRHHGDVARIEVPLADLERLVGDRAAVVGAVRAAGYRWVTVDLEGLRSGNLNVVLGPDGRLPVRR